MKKLKKIANQDLIDELFGEVQSTIATARKYNEPSLEADRRSLEAN
jgi:hypothetical protein